MKDMKIFNAFVGICFLSCTSLCAQVQVVPCQLSNPDQDTLRLFPDRTNYRTEFMRTDEVNSLRHLKPKELYKELERRLGDTWDPIWETEDIPYVFYQILQGQSKIGWVFGANQGWPGADNAQLMIGVDLEERIREFYYQKLPSLEKSFLQKSDFYAQFIGLSLEQFYIHERLEELKNTKLQSLDMIRRIQDPTKSEHEGFLKTLRGLKKILVYLDDFKFNNKIKKDEVFAAVDYVVGNEANIPLLNEEEVLKAFPGASRSVTGLVSIDPIKTTLESRLNSSWSGPKVVPTYTVYQDIVYQEPFVRGGLLGYVVPFTVNGLTGIIAIQATGAEKGKIISLKLSGTAFTEFNGISLVHFYTKEFLDVNKLTDEKLDRIGPIRNLKVGNMDVTETIKTQAKEALILVDECYSHNFFNKQDIMRQIREYKEKS
jgi:hypothetical protein